MAAFEDTVEWDAKGAVGTPATDLTNVIEWTAKGAHTTPSTDISDVAEWVAEGSFVPTHFEDIIVIFLS
jgi:hypothetical protein